jgi:magnesium-transporting ATPase (P-type)
MKVPRAQPDERPPWHALTVDGVFTELDSSLAGLSEAEAQPRLRKYGPNALPEPPSRSLLRTAIAQLASPLIYLLLAAALAALFLGEFANALFVGAVLVLNSTIGGIQEWRAESQGIALRSSIKGTSRVLRDGTVKRLNSVDLVPGDVVATGGRRPSSCRYPPRPGV